MKYGWTIFFAVGAIGNFYFVLADPKRTLLNLAVGIMCVLLFVFDLWYVKRERGNA